MLVLCGVWTGIGRRTGERKDDGAVGLEELIERRLSALSQLRHRRGLELADRLAQPVGCTRRLHLPAGAVAEEEDGGVALYALAVAER